MNFTFVKNKNPQIIKLVNHKILFMNKAKIEAQPTIFQIANPL